MDGSRWTATHVAEPDSGAAQARPRGSAGQLGCPPQAEALPRPPLSPLGPASGSVLAPGIDSRPRLRVPTVRAQRQGRRRVHGQLVQAGREFMIVVQRLVPCDRAPGMARHAPHDLDEARLDAAPGLVERLVLADGLDQVVPLQLVRVGLRLGERPDQVVPDERQSMANL